MADQGNTAIDPGGSTPIVSISGRLSQKRSHEYQKDVCLAQKQPDFMRTGTI